MTDGKRKNGAHRPWFYEPFIFSKTKCHDLQPMELHTEGLVELGKRIRDRRKSLGFSQEKFAHHAGIDRSYMGAIERGQRNVTFFILCDLARGLECDLGTLLHGLPEKTAPRSEKATKREKRRERIK